MELLLLSSPVTSSLLNPPFPHSPNSWHLYMWSHCQPSISGTFSTFPYPLTLRQHSFLCLLLALWALSLRLLCCPALGVPEVWAPCLIPALLHSLWAAFTLSMASTITFMLVNPKPPILPMSCRFFFLTAFWNSFTLMCHGHHSLTVSNWG